MSYEVVYTALAEQDLIDILAYGIEIWGELQAEKMYVQIIEQLEQLYFFPYRSKSKGSLGTRELLVGQQRYRAILQIHEEQKQVLILRILHTSQDH
ncbi:type II toxin-antitoxin system RelE/ParE family toxin [Acinetobacter ursingii]|uniref:type II toxin-antitoxin system RelE/ParE family toxin n=1 Tax=Acinetobacter ursingii TaxID=108980 RepID=UPI0019576CF7|nr:type II toxin-antitoxin system RelE/ParE family toxin [Acinetobacter ursingii]VTX88209.1 Plasmid stabilisation system protein [Acinetobacter ursingii]